MSYSISKELFEAVYNEDLLRIEVGTYSIVAYLTDGTEFTENIDTFFFDCKEWLLNILDIDISTKVSKKEVIVELYIKEIVDFNYFHSISEQQAVFDACMYILDKDKQ